MSTIDDQVTVLRLACLTQDRDPAEQRSMLAQALALDIERGRFVDTNFRDGRSPVPPTLVELVRVTYQPEGRRVDLAKAQRARYDRLDEQWDVCVKCGAPRGMHPAEGCPQRPVEVARVLAALASA